MIVGECVGACDCPISQYDVVIYVCDMSGYSMWKLIVSFNRMKVKYVI